MRTFGQNLRFHRRQSLDPHRGGLLTQERLGELIGVELGDAGYSGAAVSDWERDQSKIAEDDRLVLVSLITILRKCGGLKSTTEANELLQAGNYRALNAGETMSAFPEAEFENERSVNPPSAKPLAGKAIEVEIQDPEQYPQRTLSKERRKQLLLLEKVYSFWVEGVLQTSVHDAALLSLAQERRDDLIVDPWNDVIGTAGYENGIDDLSENIVDSYMMADRALLILGEPGAGKTTTLLMLASELITRARNDPIVPIPVILSLGSWTQLRRPISDWIIEELTNKYQIPRMIGRGWLEQDELVVLLDGFDEVPERFGDECTQAINRFRKMRGLTGIVICSRSQEFGLIRTPILLGGAVVIQPLHDDQINSYLAASGSRLTALRSAIKNDTQLKSMARSPLMLSVMSSAYSNSQEDLIGIFDEKSDLAMSSSIFWRRHLFDAYVRRMFRSRGSHHPFTNEQTEIWLGWLARHMFHFNNSQLLIEQLQPSWLPNRDWRWYYLMAVGFISGFTGGIIMWLFLQVIRLSDPQLPAPLSSQMVHLLRITEGPAETIAIIVGNIVLGLVVALLQGNYFERLRLQDKESESRGWLFNRHLASVALVVGLLTTATVALASLPYLGLIWGITEVVMFVTIARYVYGRSYRHDIRTVEALGWSWSRAFRGLVIGLVLTVIAEIIGLIFFSAPINLRSEIILVAGGFTLGGLRGRQVEEKTRPNQGIYLSFRNSFGAAIISTIVVGILALLVRSPIYALLTAAMTFIIAGSLLGGSNVIKHFLVRLLLWLNGDIPWRLADFLDYTASLVFVRKVGGSYIFLHRLLQKHFASLSSPSTKPERLKMIDASGLKRNLGKSKNF